MNDQSKFRLERIEKLLNELRYEVTRGILENDIQEEINFRFIVPRSRAIPDGVVGCEFRSRPILTSQSSYFYLDIDDVPGLRLVKKQSLGD